MPIQSSTMKNILKCTRDPLLLLQTQRRDLPLHECYTVKPLSSQTHIKKVPVVWHNWGMAVGRVQQAVQCGWSSFQGVCQALVPWALLTILSFVWRPHGQHYIWEAFLLFPVVNTLLWVKHPLFEMLFALGSAVVIVSTVNCYFCSSIARRGTGRKAAVLVELNFPAGL